VEPPQTDKRVSGGQQQQQGQQGGQQVNHFAGISGAAAAAAGGGATGGAVNPSAPPPDSGALQLAIFKAIQKMGSTFSLMDVFSAVRSMPSMAGATADLVRKTLNTMVSEGDIQAVNGTDVWARA
jgi:hypothetical protein